MAAEQQVEGTIIRGADGSLYFLRKEVLEATKVTEPEMQEFLTQVVEDKAERARAMNAAPFPDAVTVRGPFTVDGDVPSTPRFAVRSTVMCAGNMRLFDVDVIPPTEEI